VDKRVRGKSLGIVVTFNPDDALHSRLDRLARQVDGVVVVDNSPNLAERESVARTCSALGCKCVTNGANLGVAEALNRGILAAIDEGAAYVLTMDQDSLPDVAMVAELHRAFRAATQAGEQVGLVAPGTRDVFSADQHTAVPRSGDWTTTKLAITSGSLIPVAVIEAVGLFRAEFFIDSIDQEFCLRLAQAGFKIISAPSALLEHRLGSPRIRHFFGMRFIPTNHSAERRFFMARNVLWTARLFASVDAPISLLLIFKLFKNAALIAAFEDDKLAKLRATAAGLMNGIFTAPAPIRRLEAKL
jgi:rhamnosyltransferase